MNKKPKIGIVILVVIIAGVFLISRMPYTAQVAVIDDKVTSITDHMASMYLVKTNAGYLAIDTDGDAEAIRKGLAQANIDPQAVKMVFLTHSDVDHIGGYALFEGAQLYVSQSEKQMIDSAAPRFKYLPFMKNQLPGEKYSLLAENDVIEIDGVTVKVVSLPGHTPGSVGYLVDGKYFFVGDALNLENGLAVPFIAFFTMDMAQMEASIREIANDQGIQYLLTGHSGYTADYAKAMSAWKK